MSNVKLDRFVKYQATIHGPDGNILDKVSHVTEFEHVGQFLVFSLDDGSFYMQNVSQVTNVFIDPMG